MASTYADELRAAATGLRTSIATHLKPSDAVQLDALLSSVAQFGRAWSGSNLGFHSCVYYQDFAPPPAGAHFSSEWGFNGMFQGTTGNWEEHDRNDVTSAILHRAGDVDLDAINVRVEKIRKDFTDEQATIVSILSAFQQFTPDEYVAKLHDKAETIKVATTARLAHAARSRFAGAQIMSRDAVAIGQGFTLSPHEMVSIEVHALTRPTEQSDELATLAERAAGHIERLAQVPANSSVQVGTRVFIGHGRSPLWRELKDFVSDRLNLPYEEFNRVPVAGTTNVDRLSQMLDNAAVAFLILTAEDEKADHSFVARQNVVQEAGLFQGRLGFSRAIVMVEHGCEPFSNIDGLGQLRFPAGNIAAAFEEVRRVLEREKLVAEA